MRMYTNKWLYSVIASLAPFKERFQASAGCNTKNTWGTEPLHTVIVIKICTRADLNCTKAEKRLQRPLQVFGAELKTFPLLLHYIVTEELRYHYEARVPTKKLLKICIDGVDKA